MTHPDRRCSEISVNRRNEQIGKYRRWRTGVIGLTLLVHLCFCFLHHGEPRGDAAEYHALAANVLIHGRYALEGDEADHPGPSSARRMPLYPLCLAALYSLTGVARGVDVAPIIQAVLMVCNVALVIAIARRYFGDGPALLAGVLACFYQAHLHLPTELLSENLYLPLLLSVLYLLTRDTDRPVPVLAAAFALLGLLVLTRANAIAVVPFAMIRAWRELRRSPSRVPRMAALIGCLLVPLVLWWVRNAVVFERPVWLSTNGGWNFYLGHNPRYRELPGLGAGTDYAIYDRLMRQGLTEPQVDRELYRRGLSFASAHPTETLVNVCRKARVVFTTHTPQTWNFVAIASIFVGLMACFRPGGRSWRRVTGLILIGFGLVLWGAQIRSLFLAGRGLAGVGISFSLVGVAALAGLAVAWRRGQGHWLLPAVYFSQVAVCLVYIPIVRIRWSVDAIAIIYAAGAVCALTTHLGKIGKTNG